MVRNAGFLNCSLNGMPMVFFQESEGETETMSTTFYRTKEEALKAIKDYKDESSISRPELSLV